VKIFISYTSSDKEWAQWIGWTLQEAGHEPFIYDWEIGAGENIAGWMEERLKQADLVIAVFSDPYCEAAFSQGERWAAYWNDPRRRNGFFVPIEVRQVSDWPPIIASLKRLSLIGLNESEASQRLIAFLQPSQMPTPLVNHPNLPVSGVSFTEGSEPLGSNPPGFPVTVVTKNYSLRVRSLDVSNIGAFENLQIHFSPNFNLICGANGVGKTTILSVIARAFSFHQSSVRRRASATSPGHWRLEVDTGGTLSEATGDAQGLLPLQHDSVINTLNEQSRFLLHFKASRDFLYSRLDGIGRDPQTEANYWSSTAIAGIGQDDLKRWLANRYLFSAHPGSLSKRQIQDLEFSKECFSILDANVQFSKVDAASFDVYVRTPEGEFPFEYLSSGFRASLAMLLGIVREIEIRTFEITAKQFEGVILIDELDLHLHPTWQRLIVHALKRAFPLAQFIVTTHSPHMIQDAEVGEVIALLKDENGNPRIGNFHVGKYGFQGWTLEEILRDVMGLQNTQSDAFSKAMMEFDRALDDGSGEQTRYWLAQLESMLNPSNNLRKLLRMQAAPLEGKSDD
jgi:energy-coupling factor transporter ATP-binding protein EcfA2